MKRIFYCMLAVTIMTLMLVGCKNGIPKESFLKGEWDYTKPDTVPNSPNDPYGADMTTNYFVKCDLYDKINLGEGYPRCYGIYQETNEVNQTELAFDSILYLSVDSAEVLASNIDYPEEPKNKIYFKYNDKDSTLTVSRAFQNEDGSANVIEKITLFKYNGKSENQN